MVLAFILMKFLNYLKVLCLLGGFGVKLETYDLKIFETSDESMISSCTKGKSNIKIEFAD